VRVVLVLVDTTVLVDHLRGLPAATAWLAALDAPPLCSEVSRAELVYGLRSTERAAAERLFSAVRWLPVDEAVARQAGEYGRRYRRSHTGIGMADLLIAATAATEGATLATSNLRHYPMFPRLRVPY